MKKFDVANKSNEELMNALKEMRDNLHKMSFQKAESKLKDTTQLSKTKKDIARILTALNK